MRGRAMGVLARSAWSGSVASVLSTAALAAAARMEGKAAAQPLNATSHWLHGPGAAAVRRADAAHTAVGYATHHAACVFWAVLFEGWVGRRPPSALAIMGRAAATSAIAVVVDYTITPKRFTPGWELVLSKRAMAGVYGAMALGLAAGARRRAD